MHPDPLRTVNQASERLNVSRVTIYKLLRSGQLASLKIGRVRRIPESAISEFVSARTQRGAA